MNSKLELADLEFDIFKLCNIDSSFLVKIIGNLKKEYFESSLLSKLFIVYQGYYTKFNQKPTRKIVETQLLRTGETKERIDSILDRIFNEDIKLDQAERDYVYSEVDVFAKRSRMKTAIFKCADLLEEDKFEEIISEVKDALMFNLDVNLGYDLYDIDERYKSLHDSLMNKLTTGFASIDDILYGGWARKEIYAFQSPPGFGKSIWLVNCGFRALYNGYNVVHYSLEMSEDRLGMRYDAVASKLSFEHLMDSQDEIKKAYGMIKKLTNSRLIMKEFPTSMASVLDIEAHLENLRLYEDFIPDIVIVDYGDIMRSTKNSSNGYEEQGWIFRELRGMAVKRNVVVLTATQSKRDALSADGGTKEVIGMDQVADSMEKNRILDTLFSITQSRLDKEDQVTKLWVAKNRNGKANKELVFKINYRNLRLSEPKLGLKDND